MARIDHAAIVVHDRSRRFDAGKELPVGLAKHVVERLADRLQRGRVGHDHAAVGVLGENQHLGVLVDRAQDRRAAFEGVLRGTTLCRFRLQLLIGLGERVVGTLQRGVEPAQLAFLFLVQGTVGIGKRDVGLLQIAG